MTEHGFHDASTDPETIRRWWARSPHALIGMPTGERTGLAVLDVDMKNGVNGLRTLAGVGFAELPITPTVLTQTGGYHLHFMRPEDGFGNTAGAGGRGIGPGLDWRCDGGYVVLPAPGTGYRWHEERHYGTCWPPPIPEALLPRPPARDPFSRYRAGVSARLAAGPTTNCLIGVERCLLQANEGERNHLLFWAGCRFAEAVAVGLLLEEDARRILIRDAEQIGLDRREIPKTISSAFRTYSRSATASC